MSFFRLTQLSKPLDLRMVGQQWEKLEGLEHFLTEENLIFGYIAYSILLKKISYHAPL